MYMNTKNYMYVCILYEHKNYMYVYLVMYVLVVNVTTVVWYIDIMAHNMNEMFKA